MKEFNTLAVVFGQPSTKFIEDKYQLRLDRAPLKDDAFEFAPEAGTATAAPVYTATDIMGSEDLLGGGYGDDDNKLISGGATTPVTGAGVLQLQPNQKVEPATFQGLWGGLAETFNGQIVQMATVVAIPQLTACLATANVTVVASGALPDGGAKLFLYGALTDDSSLLASGEKVQYLAQLVVQGSGHVSAMIKTDSTLPGCANNFADLLRGSLGNL